jgi:N6-L-threonylcarbamoyladenine synthase
MTILAIESSCDETSAAVIQDFKVLSNIISSQYFHKKFGGVVPELASRAHLQAIHQITQDALTQSGKTIEEIDALAVTREPGLIGSLIVGSNFAKGLALRYNLPLVPVNHIEGHLFSGNINEEFSFPFISLVVSGGHTAIFLVQSFNEYELLGSTIDDAAGEAFDKTAKLLGLPYPGGPEIDKLAKQGNPSAFNFPRSMINSGDYNFSFSGLKTSVRYFLQKNYPEGVPEELMPDISASVQQAIVDVLVSKTVRAALANKVETIVIAGGVSANSGLRKKMQDEARKNNMKSVAPEMAYCMDNAAMIGFIAAQKIKESGLNKFNDLSFTAGANSLRAKRK